MKQEAAETDPDELIIVSVTEKVRICCLHATVYGALATCICDHHSVCAAVHVLQKLAHQRFHCGNYAFDEGGCSSNALTCSQVWGKKT
jgi:hypothetical protein